MKVGWLAGVGAVCEDASATVARVPSVAFTGNTCASGLRRSGTVATKAPPRRFNGRGLDPRRMSPLSEEQATCRCGCGEVPPAWARTQTVHGRVKGERRKWVPGHYHRRDPARQLAQWIGEPDENGCWPWTGRKVATGYGQITFGGTQHQAHRFSYEHYVGSIPEGMELDHLCRNRACVNPVHLEPVTHAENMARSAPAQQTHCIHGHEFTPENTYRQWTGGRGCRECRRRSGREAMRRKRARDRVAK